MLYERKRGGESLSESLRLLVVLIFQKKRLGRQLSNRGEVC